MNADWNEMTVLRAPTNDRDVIHYFEYSNHGIEVDEEGLTEVPFGEFLLENSSLTRTQLLSALPTRRAGSVPHRHHAHPAAFVTGGELQGHRPNESADYLLQCDPTGDFCGWLPEFRGHLRRRLGDASR